MRKRRLGQFLALLAALALLVAGLVLRPDRPAAQATDAAAPLRILLGWSGDAATSQAVTWRTLGALARAQAQIGQAPAGDSPAGEPATITGTSRAVRLRGGRSVVHHRVDFTGLRPSARYAYRVGDGRRWSNWHTFTTASAEPDPFRFVYLGDAQNGLLDRWPPIVRAARKAVPDARFVVHAGDLVAEGYDDRQWEAWIAGMSPFGASVPNVPAPGNHDLRVAPAMLGDGPVFQAPPLWNAHFALPANGPSELQELAGQNYVLDYQGVRVVVVDVNAFVNDDFVKRQRSRVQDALVTWLRQALATNPGRWTIVVQHQPVLPVAKDRTYMKMRTAIGALYDEYGVDLVLQGHEHVYSRTHMVRGERLASPGGPGTIYVVSVSGPKMYRVSNPRAPLMAVLREHTQLFQVITVERDRLAYESRTMNGSLADAFELVKSAAGTVYVNKAPRAGAPKQEP